MFNDDPSVSTLRRIASAHMRLGVRALLPTLITDTAEKTRAAIAAAVDAIREGTPGIAGLHLEGPHLSVARKGAHDAALIRRMEQDDLDVLLEAAGMLPVLMVTVAPE
ncbi:MAG: N-acetylglucosamine-6-phosphate deacetylase, partial [Pseudomonadota bacterium]